MSKLILYKDARERLETVCGIKYVRLFNNQFEREKKENPFLFPCALIEFKPSQHRNFPYLIQEYDLTMTVHIGWESYEDDDIAILTFKQEVYKALQGLQSEYYSVLTRTEERPPVEHDNIQDYQMDFFTRGMDYDADTRPKLKKIISPEVTGERVLPTEL
jgi:hypothetical protein